VINALVIEGFVKAVLASRYDNPKPIPLFHRELWELCCGPEEKVAIGAPRGHGKSTAITGSYVIAGICFREFRHILILSANEELASGFVRDIANEFNENEVLREQFHFSKWIKESETELVGMFADGHKFRIVAKGAGQRMRGLKWERKRPDLVIGDDLEDDEIVLNKDRREKFKRWFYGAVLPIVKDGGKVRIVGTIVHMDSLLENFMPPLKEETTVVSGLRIYSVDPSPVWRAVKYRAHTEDFSEILWPEQFSKDKLLKIRRDFARQGLLDVYGQEYLNDPIDDSTAYFKDEDFKEILPEWKLTPRKKNYYAGIDFAISETEKADYTAIAVVSRDDAGRIEVETVRRGRWDSRGIINEMFLIHKHYEPDLFIAEQGAIQKSIGPFLNEEMLRRGVFLNIHPKTPTKDKQSRARSLQAKMRAGAVYFDPEAEWYTELYEEMRRFPKSAHDDQVDALVWAGLALDEMIDPPTPEEDEEEEYQNALGQAGNDGRSKICGY
jgi:predicted phage terminase large subunit-like protein